MKWFYYDSFGKKYGPVSDAELKSLANSGTINRNTQLETETGHQGKAGQLRGLFPAASGASGGRPQRPQAPSPPPSPSGTGEKSYCSNCGAEILPQAHACMRCGANPRAHRKFCKKCGAPLNPEQIVCIKCGMAVSGSGRYSDDNYSCSAGSAHAGDAKLMEDFFEIFRKCYIGGIVASLIGIILLIIGAASEEGFFSFLGVMGMFVACGFSIPSVIYSCRLLYRMWCQIPERTAQTTPGKAVGFLFIPFFSLYWIFVAYKGLALSLNENLDKQGSRRTVPVDTVNLTCILMILVCIPYLGGIVAIFNIFMFLKMMRVLKDGAVTLAELRG